MRIAYVVSTFPPYRGGMGNVAFELAKSVALQNGDVTVFTPRYGRFDTDYKSIFNVYKLKTRIRYGNSALLFKLLWRAWDYDIIHLHYPFIGASLPCILLKLFRGKKQKLFVHYHMDLVGRNVFRPIFLLYSKMAIPLLVRLADHVFVTSKDYGESSKVGVYMKMEKYENKFSVLPNGVDVNRFSPAVKLPSLIKRFNAEGKMVILFVGGLDSAHYFKGLNYLLNAMCELNKTYDLRLVVVGDGDLRSVYEEMSISFGLENKVFFTGYATDEELVQYYQVADVCVLPSIDRSEAFGVVLIEAMACGKPVIASDLPGVREVVRNNLCGRLTRPKDVESIIRKIKFFINNQSELTAYGLAGREVAVANYSWQSIGERALKKYHELFDNKL